MKKGFFLLRFYAFLFTKIVTAIVAPVTGIATIVLASVCSSASESSLSSIHWELSEPILADKISLDKYPSEFNMFRLKWQNIYLNKSGTAQIPAITTSTKEKPQYVFTRLALYSTKSKDVTLSLNSVETFSVFLNHQYWPYKDNKKASVIKEGFHRKSLMLPLKKGLNEILIQLAAPSDTFSLRVFAKQALEPLPMSAYKVSKAWEVAGFNIPESVVFDSIRQRLYVSNFGQYKKNNGAISMVSLDGNTVKRDWVAKLDNPTGLYLFKDELYVVERNYLTIIDVQLGKVKQRYDFPKGGFYNDVVINKKGTIFVSDTSRPIEEQDILRFQKGRFEPWIKGDAMYRSNALYPRDHDLIAGSTGNGLLQSISFKEGKIKSLVTLAGGIIDGIKLLSASEILISHWKGSLYVLTDEGELSILNAPLSAGQNAADFEYIPEHQLLFIPTFFGGKLLAYRIETKTK